jgi:hypothetical protein
MQPDLVPLCDSLKDAIGVFARLLELSDAQRAALLLHDTPEVDRLTAAQDALSLRAAQARDRSRRALESVASALDLSPAAATLTDVADRIGAPAAANLQGLRDDLAQTLDELGRRNLLNALLLESAMDAVRFTFLLIGTGCAPPAAAYGPTHAPVFQNEATPVAVDFRA